MGAFEYLLLFAAIILGLAVTDLALSLHRVLSAGPRVKWDLLAPLAAIVAFLKIVTQWWTWHAAEHLAQGLTFEMFLGVLLAAVLLFLIAAAALPDEIGAEPLDLAAHYAAVFRRYWLLFLLHWLLGNAVSLWAQVRIQGAHLTLLSPAYLLAPLIASLVFVRHRAWHAACLMGFVGLYLWQFFGKTLG